MLEFLTPEICGWTLARAHARSGDAVELAAYLGKERQVRPSRSPSCRRYADQSEHDYQEFTTAIKSGRLTCVEGVYHRQDVASWGAGRGAGDEGRLRYLIRNRA